MPGSLCPISKWLNISPASQNPRTHSANSRWCSSSCTIERIRPARRVPSSSRSAQAARHQLRLARPEPRIRIRAAVSITVPEGNMKGHRAAACDTRSAPRRNTPTRIIRENSTQPRRADRSGSAPDLRPVSLSHLVSLLAQQPRLATRNSFRSLPPLRRAVAPHVPGFRL